MSIETLKERIITAECARDYYASLVESFFSGESPDGGNFNHVIMAQWGRKRLVEKASTRAILLGGQG